MVVLVGIGLALVAFGALVLLRFPDRPGGRLGFGGMEVSSVGAGLPLVALGVAAVAVGVLHQPSTPTDTDGGAGGTGGGSGAQPPEPGFVSECTAAFLAADPAVARERQRQLNESLEDVDVLGPDEPKQREFALVLADGASASRVRIRRSDASAKGRGGLPAARRRSRRWQGRHREQVALDRVLGPGPGWHPLLPSPPPALALPPIVRGLGIRLPDEVAPTAGLEQGLDDHRIQFLGGQTVGGA